MIYKPNVPAGSPTNGGSTNSQEGRAMSPTPASDVGKEADKAAEKVTETARDVKDRAGDIKNEAKNTASDMASDVKDQTAEVADEVKESLSGVAQDVDQATSRLADKVQQSGEKVIEATREYAKNAVDAAGKKVRQVQGQYESAKSSTTDYIQEDPVRAVKIAAIGSAVLTAALIGIFRRR